MKLSIAVIILFICVIFMQVRSIQREQILKYDASGYHLYLPALLIFNDLSKLSFYPYLDSIYQPSGKEKNYALFDHEQTHRRSNKYAVGLSIAELPFFVIGHVYTKYFAKDYPADGYSKYYQYTIAFSNIFWSIMGLIALASFLKNYYTDLETAVTLFLIAFGTNYYCYTAFFLGMSHNFLFFLFSCLLLLTNRWYQNFSWKYTIYIGLILGWILISRPIDFIIFLIPVFWPFTTSQNKARNPIEFWKKHRRAGFFCMTACFIVSIIQLAYWKYTTGHFIHFSYEGEGFDFLHPRILNGLFSVRKGWFVYTPIALLGFLGFIPLYRYNKKATIVLISFFILFIYLVFSWKTWWYGWGFGSRATIESLAILSIPLACLIRWICTRKKMFKMFCICIGLLLVTMNMYQTEQFSRGIIMGDHMDWPAYKAAIFHLF